ncbi:MAG TPA: DUF1194 domain-containing protein [Aestuariivirgaceae bacterium]|nr:DUF1194 domain-containing protein [Aestuariivirgaceae bacterium]
MIGNRSRGVMLKQPAHFLTAWQALRPVAMAMLVLALLAPTALAQRDIEVDLELVLAVDISLSMDDEEQRLQRDGYVSAIRHPDVIAAIRAGLNGRIALTYLEWAGVASQEVVVPWSLIDGEPAAGAFADNLAALPLHNAYRTSISGALHFAHELFQGSGFSSLRQVVDVSGDGANNQGLPVTLARDRLVDQGTMINGLAIMIARAGADDFFYHANLDEYFEDCVIGGPGAFVIRIDDPGHFATAIRRKMILEIAGAEPRIIPAAVSVPREPADCLVGEKRWQRLME